MKYEAIVNTGFPLLPPGLENYNISIVLRMDFIFRLCPALKAIFEHGLKKSTILGGNCHPWLFIEEVSHFLTKCMIKI